MEKNQRYPRLGISLLQLATILLLLSRAWQYLYWDSPIRTVLWDENLLGHRVANWGWTWSQWVTDIRITQGIEATTNILGIILLLGGVGAMLFHRFPRWTTPAIILGGMVSLLHALLTTKAHFYQWGHLVELSLQWMTPFLLICTLYHRVSLQFWDAFMRIAIAFTFIGHGLYAYGYYPVPGHFQGMMMSGFKVDNDTAIFLLKWAGILDFIAAALLFVPSRKWAKWGLYYTIIWGALTAFARLWSYFPNYSYEGMMSQWLSESTVRWVHFLVPIVLAVCWKIYPFNLVRHKQ